MLTNGDLVTGTPKVSSTTANAAQLSCSHSNCSSGDGFTDAIFLGNAEPERDANTFCYADPLVNPVAEPVDDTKCEPDPDLQHHPDRYSNVLPVGNTDFVLDANAVADANCLAE